MSMRENPTSGHVIRASELIPLLPLEHQPKAHDMLVNCDTQALGDFFVAHMPDVYACPFQVFTLSDQDTGDGDLAQDVLYALFDESDLYEKTPTPAMTALTEALGGYKPEMHAWTTYG